MAQIVVLKRAHYFSIDNDLIDVHAPIIGAIGVAIYTTLARFANRKTGECWPAIGRLAHTLQLARSTVKVYLRKLEEAGLIAIRERQDAAGDPTSNCYTLLDPSPSAVNKRLAARQATCTGTAAPASEGGRPPADPPPIACQPTGRPSADPQPDLDPQPKETNHAEDARAAEETPHTRTSNTCPHPLEELGHYDDITICRHCWTLVDAYADTTRRGPEPAQEDQAHAVSAA